MRYKVNDTYLEKMPCGATIIDKVFLNRGYDEKGRMELINPSESNIEDYNLLKNIDKAVDLVLDYLRQGKVHFGIVWDCDCDGITSGAILYNYLTKVSNCIRIKNYIHTGKQHGISEDLSIDENLDILFVVDGGTSDREQIKVLEEKGIRVIVLDHHELAEGVKTDYGIIVNNQLSPKINNKFLSGVGVVYKFCKKMDSVTNLNYADDFLDLVAVGNIGDAMDLRQLETRYFCLKGLKTINNPMLKAIIKKQSFSMKGKNTLKNIGFYVAPLINAMVREGKQEEKENMVKAFIGCDEYLDYQPRGKNKPMVKEHITEATARLMANAKSRQDSAVKKSIKSIEEQIESENLQKDSVIIIINSTIEKNFTGLVANKLIDKYKRPIIIVKLFKEKEEYLGGSARGFGIEDFRTLCVESGLFTKAVGHNNAFGIEFKLDNINKIKEHFNKTISVEDLMKTYIVDDVMDSQNLLVKNIIQLSNFQDMWLGTLSEPLFLIKGIKISSGDINYTDKKLKVAHFTIRGITFKKLYCKEEVYEELVKTTREEFINKDLEINIIGKLRVEQGSLGQKFPIVDIVEFESRELQKSFCDFDDLIF